MEPGGVYAKNVQLDRELSQRLHGALTCGKEELFQVVADPAPEVIRAALRNPALDENHLLILLGRRDLGEDLVAAIGRHDAVAESHKLKAALVRNPATPAQLVMSLLPHLYLFELVDLCLLAGVTPDQRVAAERAVIQRLSITPLGNKITLARRATASILDALLKEGDVRVVESCLTNPRLKEGSVFQLVSSSRATGDVIAAVARHQCWSNRPNLKAAMLKNPNTPTSLFSTLLAAASTMEVRNLAASGRLGAERKRLASQELKRRGC